MKHLPSTGTEHTTHQWVSPGSAILEVKTTPQGAPEEGRAPGLCSVGHQTCVSLEALLESWARPCKAMSARYLGSVPTHPRQGGRNGWQVLWNRTSCLIFSPKKAGGLQWHLEREEAKCLRAMALTPTMSPTGSVTLGMALSPQSLYLIWVWGAQWCLLTEAVRLTGDGVCKSFRTVLRTQKV